MYDVFFYSLSRFIQQGLPEINYYKQTELLCDFIIKNTDVGELTSFNDEVSILESEDM